MNRVDEVLISLRRIIRATDLHSKHLVKTAGLTSAQLLLMRSVRDKGAVTIGELAEAIHLSQATVTTILDRLEGRHLISRNRSTADKRKIHIHLTEAGLKLLNNAPVPLQEHFIRKFDDMQDWEQTLVLSSLQRVAQMMDANGIDAASVLDVGSLDRDVE
jgi:DNA-binding MarR family transcriptional regulator